VLSLPASLGDRRSIRILDALAVVWICLWIGIGYVVFHEVRGLSSLSGTVVLAGRAIDATASTIASLAGIPLVGTQVGDLARQAQEAARSAIANGESSRENIDRLAILLWIAIAAAPTAPLLVLYGLLREGWRRDVCSLRELAAGARDDPAFDQFLARRALQHLPYRRLRELSDNPWRDIDEGNTRGLADAELARVGLRRPQPPGSHAPSHDRDEQAP
jgi:hypothetical protein